MIGGRYCFYVLDKSNSATQGCQARFLLVGAAMPLAETSLFFHIPHYIDMLVNSRLLLQTLEMVSSDMPDIPQFRCKGITLACIVLIIVINPQEGNEKSTSQP